MTEYPTKGSLTIVSRVRVVLERGSPVPAFVRGLVVEDHARNSKNGTCIVGLDGLIGHNFVRIRDGEDPGDSVGELDCVLVEIEDGIEECGKRLGGWLWGASV